MSFSSTGLAGAKRASTAVALKRERSSPCTKQRSSRSGAEAQWFVSLRDTLPAIVLFACLAPVAAAQTPRDDPATPRFREMVIVRPIVQAEFEASVLGYFELRTALEEGLPAQRITDNPEENIEIQRKLAKRIRRARAGARPGAIFTPAITVEFRRILEIETTPRSWRPSWTTTRDDSHIGSMPTTRDARPLRRCQEPFFGCCPSFRTGLSIAFSALI